MKHAPCLGIVVATFFNLRATHGTGNVAVRERQKRKSGSRGTLTQRVLGLSSCFLSASSSRSLPSSHPPCLLLPPPPPVFLDFHSEGLYPSLSSFVTSPPEDPFLLLRLLLSRERAREKGRKMIFFPHKSAEAEGRNVAARAVIVTRPSSQSGAFNSFKSQKGKKSHNSA